MNITLLQNFATMLTSAAVSDQCMTDDQCPSLYNCNAGVCEHKELFPMAPQEIFGATLMCILVGIANSGGMGGSFIASPILMVLFNYSPLHAIRIVYCVGFGGSLGNFMINFFNRREESARPVIDYDVALIALPMLICGTSLGAILNSVTPPVISLIGLVYLMVESFGKIYKRAVRQMKLEGKTKVQVQDESTTADAEMKEMGVDRERAFQDYYMVVENPRMAQITQEDRLLFPWRKYREIFLLVVLIIGMFLLKGTSSFKSALGVGFCGFGYWVLYFLTLGLCFVFEKRAQNILMEDAEVREKTFMMPSSEFRMTSENITKLRNFSLIGGTLSGFLGIGGGTVMNPKMLEMGLSAQSAAATSGFFVIFPGFILMFQVLLMGGLSLAEVAFFVPLSFVASLGITMFVSYLVKLYQKPSIVMMCLAGTVALGIIVIPVFSIYRSFAYPAMMFQGKGVC